MKKMIASILMASLLFALSLCAGGAGLAENEGRQVATAWLDQEGAEISIVVDLTGGWSVEFARGAVYLYDGNYSEDAESVAIGMTLEQEVFGCFEEDHGVELHADALHGVFEEFGLRDGAREAVEDESVGAFRRGEAGGDHVGHDLVGDELAGLHAGFRLFAEFGAGCHFAAEDFAGGDVRELFLRHQGIGERAFAGAGRAEQNEILFRNHKSETSELDAFSVKKIF